MSTEQERPKSSAPLTGSLRFATTLLLTAAVSAAMGYAVPKWLEGRQKLEIERRWTNLMVPANIRHPAPGSRFPYLYSTDFQVRNVGDLPIEGKLVKLRLAPSSMDCGIIPRAERRVKAYEASTDRHFDSDLDNVIVVEDDQTLSIHLASLPVGSAKTFVLFSNFASRPIFSAEDDELDIRVFSRPEKNQEGSEPERLMNCKEQLDEIARRQGQRPPSGAAAQ